MNAKQWLFRARHLDREINDLCEEKQRTRDKLLKITQSYSRSEAQTSQDPHKMDGLADLDDQIDRKVEELKAIIKETRDVIFRLDRSSYRMALNGYFLDGKTWEQVAVDMNYSFQGVMRIRKQAIKEVEKILNGNIKRV